LRVALLGKVGSVIHWLEDCAGALRAEGHQVHVGITRNPLFSRSIEDALLWEQIGAPMAKGIAGAIRRFGADVILAIGAYEIPYPILAQVASIPDRPPFYAWIGDVFSEAGRRVAALFDAMAYTDSGLVDRHRRLGFATSAIYLPHAVNPHAAPPSPDGRRRKAMVFVANPTDHRRSVIEAVTGPLVIYGPGWPRRHGRHEIHARRVSPRELWRLYASHFAALNIRNEHNVLFGLNQRNFDPYVFATPVVTDDQPDLAGCFDEGSEVLVWRSAEELDALYARLLREPREAAIVGERGKKRVLADHTYSRRLESLSRLT
jgi:spore maturation protein CgeB